MTFSKAATFIVCAVVVYAGLSWLLHAMDITSFSPQSQPNCTAGSVEGLFTPCHKNQGPSRG